MNVTACRTQLLAAALVALALVGCETVRPPAVPTPTVAPATTDSAEKAEREGQFVVAAREYARLAATSSAPQKQHFELRAAEAMIKAGQAPEARALLRGINVQDIDPSFAARKRILEARLLSLEGAHEKAIRQLDEAAKARNLNPALMAELYAARAQAEAALDNPIGALRNLIAREGLIVGKEAVADNQLQIWKILNATPRARLYTERQLTGDAVLGGWIDLALIAVDSAGIPARMEEALTQWRAANPKHPASEALIAIVAKPTQEIIGRIERIALLLPLSSSHSVAAQAVRDGFLAMDAANRNADKPAVKIYDTGADAAKTADFYQLAVKEGAQVVVGPLGRESVENVIRRNVVNVPTLLLSHTDDESTASLRQLFQFGLPPEQEARQAAERAYLDGHRQAAVLYPQGAWGERMMNAFVATWQSLGGVVVASQPYREEEADHSEAIKQMLNVHHSLERKLRIEQVLRTKIPFEAQHARARQDIGAIFLVADAKRGRLLKPQLNFYQAGRIPVYATSHIYTGKANPLQDADLDGVLFGDMPWMLVNSGKVQQLRQSLQGGWPHAFSDLDRLYALGMDSYAILPHLNRIGTEAGVRFNGVTSGLSLDRGGRLQRSLTWARFNKGVPKLVDTTAQRPGRLELESLSGS
jgi:hypothetical protein